ncbi:exodeoxyribonuclease VII large subunit [Anaerobacillus alkalidiazotrophicus]|uniref:Exodeoxyribonuclease 7 large subunit n=1 Tax=Anaerobacillus alkalidiazotrophicus TaxID=472963 RepID=A0A1S2M6I4_9BACI|nr:exodeoxyribonuclease VII large subunit [Anaerobacillus alkalidiazotrophicus]OIJ20311.1 exodeoxyribonuclease VII large subunit [Anaerobacillus alkalidiazotrophicus]
MSNDQIFTITSLTKYIKRTFDNDEVLKNIWVKGELSNFKKHSRGHMYFTIKDTQSRIQAVMFAGNNRFLKFIPEDGMKVLIRGYVSVYEANGQYQMYVNEMQPDGVGNLYLAFEQLKKKLEIAGYFDEKYKKKIPSLPTKIGVITSPTGAAIRDIITTLKRRFPIASITLFPVLVQGGEAPASIAKAIQKANNLGDLDVLIVGRGGGSIEELWAFNEEIVAEAIFESNIPVISAVGHETDVTIADFIADLRAATPTAAAELAVPNTDDLLEKVTQRKIRFLRAIVKRIETERRKLTNLQKSYAFRYPEQLIKQKEQQLDRQIEDLQRSMMYIIERKRSALAHLQKDVVRNHPHAMVLKVREQLLKNETLLQQSLIGIQKEKEFSFKQLLTKLESLSPLKVMTRGYSLAYTKEDKLIKSVTDVSKGEELTIKLKDGSVYCQVENIKEV